MGTKTKGIKGLAAAEMKFIQAVKICALLNIEHTFNIDTQAALNIDQLATIHGSTGEIVSYTCS